MLPIIEAHNIGKKFRIFHKDMPYLSLRDNIVSYIKNPVRLFQNHTEEFWALKDVSFEVMPGESVGIIGKNGAGKSTLLKILSRITPPTTGKITLRGRVASLLEVGTGFHPELTGRENVFFNGAILGMKRSEIKQKFDEIVAFAGVEKFIDTPLKHYSSGMQLRLAFAVAAFLEAEILVVDEVLAVGDAEFQKKCLGKMEDVTKNEGRTVLFVSHNMDFLRRICSKGILLESGNVKDYDSITKTTRLYYNFIEKSSNGIFLIKNHSSNEGIIEKIYLKDIDNNVRVSFQVGEPFVIQIQLKTYDDIPSFSMWLKFKNELGLVIRHVFIPPNNLNKGTYTFIAKENLLQYGKGKYFVDIELMSRTFRINYYQDVCYLEFIDYNPNKIFIPFVEDSQGIINLLDYNFNSIE